MIIDRQLADCIDFMLCPTEGAMLLAEIRVRLPDLHRPIPRTKRLTRLGGTPLYFGEAPWAGVSFAYVQARDKLILLEAWVSTSRPRPRLDCILLGDGPEMVKFPVAVTG